MNTYLLIAILLVSELAMCLETIAFSLWLKKVFTGEQTCLFIGGYDGSYA